MVTRSPEAFYDLLFDEKVTVLNQTPSAFRQFMRVDEYSDASRNLALRLVIFGGEALDIAGLKPWFERHGDRQPQLVNMYGITETTVHVTYRPLIKEDALYNASLIGVPIPDLQLYILDEHLQPVPFDMRGEIYVSGAGVARGYLNRPELTAERFIPNPFGNCPGSRLYKTGDAARRLSKGDIEYLGRTDLQVKIRGFRIELGEIEVALLDHPKILDALVIARDSGADGKQLIAYVVPDPQSVPTVIELRNSLKKKLPDYMLPAQLVMLDAFPLTINGKVDRLALPAPEVSRSELSREYAAAQTVSEELLVAIWSEILRVERIGVHDNFFELGGDSILSIQIIARANQAGLRLTPRQLFEHQTIAELAAVAGTTEAITAEQGRVSGAIPLTPIQHWFFSQQLNAPHHFNQSLLLSLRQPVSASVLEQAVTALVDHHDALRLRYRRTEQGWEQFNAAAESNPIFSEVDLSDLPADEQALAIEARAGEMQASLELEHGPLLKVVYFDLGVERGRRLLIIIHHLAVDGVSWRILLEDLVLGCEQARVGKPISFSPKTTSFKQWAEQLQKYAASAEVAEQASYWLEIAARSQSVRPLPVELQGKNNKVSAARSVSVSLSAEETQALLQEVPDVYQTQIQEVLLAALLETLSEWSGERRVLIEVEGHGREEIGSELDVTRTVGWFTTQYPVVLEKQEGSKTGELLKQVKEQVRGVPKRGTGYGLLKYMSDEASVREEMRRGLEAQVSFNYLGQFDQALNQGELFELANESVGPVVSPNENRQHLFEINGSVIRGHLRLGWGYSEELHRRETIKQLAEAFKENLQKLIAHCRSPEARDHAASDFPLVQFDQAVLQEFERSNEKIEDIYPLSPLQLGLFFLKRFAPDSEEYFNQFSFRLHGPLDTEALAGAWQRVVQRHQVLRSGFHWDGLKQPVQVVHREVKIFLEQLDWRKLSPAEQQEQLGPFLIADRQRGMNFSEPPLMRLTLIRLADESYQFIWSHHHILLDGWSLFRVLNEALSIYEALLRGEELQLERPRPYRNYIAWLQQQDMKKAEQFWSETLKGFSGPAPVMLEEGSGETETESRHAEHQITLPAETHAALKASARAQRVTVNTMLQGAWALLLSHYSGVPDVVFGGVVSGRPSELSGAENMVGLFINTLPVRVQIAPDQPVMSWLQQLQERQSIARQYDYSSLADVQRWSEVKRGEVLFESVYAFENYPIDAALREHKGSLEVSENRLFERIHYPLNLIVKPSRELVLQIWYDSQRFSSAAIKRMSEKLESILAAFVANPEQKLKQVPLLTEAERKAPATARTTAASEPLPVTLQPSLCLHQQFEQQAARTPNAIALIFEGQQLTYAELNGRANQLAHYLRGLGVRAEVPVGMLMKRSLEMIVGVLGILKAGGAYVPLDPEYPKERLAFMLGDTHATLVLTQQQLAEHVSEGVRAVALDADWEQIARESEANPAVDVTPDNAAYVIYTSGSTGKPKGVLVTHQNVLRLFESTQTRFGFTEQDVWTLFHSYAFDFSVWEIWGALLHGGRLVVVPYVVSRSPEAFYNLLVAERVTVLNQTPSAFTQLIGAADKAQNIPAELSLRLIIFGGETLNLPALKGWFDRYGDERPRLINGYGITETTVFVTFHPVSSAQLASGRDVIGSAINDLKVYILNPDLQPVPTGVSGELFVGGAGLARGYVNRPDLNAERFIPDPFSREPGARLYRSGDRARFLDGENIEYLGRIDRQVKSRGHRIELGEIETVLSRFPGIRQAVVTVREDAHDDQKLVAYLVPDDDYTPAIDQLQNFAKKELPAYMVPAARVLMKSLPLTSSGKVDYRALPAPEIQAQPARADFVPPRNELEKQVAAIWTRVLGVENVGVHDNFYDLGGHSILMAQVFNEVREVVNREVAMVELFEHPTISALARHLSRDKEVAAAAAAANSPAQVEKQREGKDRLRQQFRQRQRGRRG
jgi:amino acid adenylation domain-containing protein/non-ribosomal peptide synthase protein (TIGR01720 family)